MKRPTVTVPEEGTKIRLINMPEDPNPVPSGSTGTVSGGTSFGDWAQIHVNWDNGRTLSLSVPPDTYEIIGS